MIADDDEVICIASGFSPHVGRVCALNRDRVYIVSLFSGRCARIASCLYTMRY